MEKQTILKTIRKSSSMLVSATVVSAGFVVFWLFFRHKVYDVFQLNSQGISSRELGSDLVVLLPGIIYGIIFGEVLARCQQQNQKIHAAIDTMNAVAFLEERDRRTPLHLHGLMLVISMMTTVMFFLLDYSSIRVGCFFIGTFVFMAVVGLKIVLELDNPFEGNWKIPEERIPDKWMTMTANDIKFGRVPQWDNMIDDHGKPEHLPSLEEATLEEAPQPQPEYRPEGIGGSEL